MWPPLIGRRIMVLSEDFFIHGGGAAAVGMMMNINQINLVIHAVNNDVIFQYWSLKSDQQQQQLNSSSSSSSACHDQHHRDHDDDDEEMIMIICRPSNPPNTADPIILLDREGVFASVAAATGTDDDDDYIMSQLRDMDIFYEMEWIFKQEQLEEVKRCIIQRISESKPALLLAKPKAVRIRVDLSTILMPTMQLRLLRMPPKTKFIIHYPATPTTFYDDADYKPSRTALTTALRSSKEALETKILEEEDLISSSSSCSVCLDEFRVGVDEIKKMPCSHVFHWNCLMNWLWERNTCPLCYYPLPTF